MDDDRMTEVVKAVTFIQSVMQEPWVKKILSSLGGDEMNDAEAGRPAPARPKPALTIPAAPAAVPAETQTAAPKSEGMPPPPVPNKVVSGGGENGDGGSSLEAQPEEIINSSTHHQAHAHLGRRMQSLGPADCPQMTALWNGSRKDTPHVCHCLKFWYTFGFQKKHDPDPN